MALIHPVLVASTLVILSGTGDKIETGTGFMVSRPDVYNYENPEEHDFANAVKDGWRVWIVTCAHLIATTTGDAPITVETNLSGQPGQKIRWRLPASLWMKHPKWRRGDETTRQYDIAVAPAPTFHERWGDTELMAWPAPWHLSRARMKNSGIVEGDEIYMVGFPLGWGYGERNNPIVRHGIIAQSQPYLREKSGVILVDGAVWFGNSGGPVVTKPAESALKGTKQYTKSSLLGMISGTNLSPKTPRGTPAGIPAGIGIVIPTSTINETIDLLIASRR